MRGCPRLMRCQILMPVDEYAGNQTLLGMCKPPVQLVVLNFLKFLIKIKRSIIKFFQEKILYNKKFCSSKNIVKNGRKASKNKSLKMR